MNTRILQLQFNSLLGRFDNPLWQTGALAQKIPSHSLWVLELIPFEQFDQLDSLNKTKEVIFQTYLSLENLNNEELNLKLKQQLKVQIWVDRPILKDEAEVLQKLLTDFPKIEVVYLPDLHSHPSEVFANLSKIPKLFVHLKTKESEFDRWLSAFEIWERICCLKEIPQIKEFETQIFEHQLEKTSSQSEELFLLRPSYKNLMNYLASEKKSQYWAQKMAQSLAHSTDGEFIFFLRQFLISFIQPTEVKWPRFLFLQRIRAQIWNRFRYGLVHPIWVFFRYDIVNFFRYRVFGWLKFSIILLGRAKNTVIFLPVRKLYWIIDHEFKKRILGIIDEKGQRRHSSRKI